MEREKSPEQLRGERIVQQASILVGYLQISVEWDSVAAAVGRKSEQSKRLHKSLQRELAELEDRREHAYELPPLLIRFERGIALDANNQRLRDRALNVFRIKPLTEAESERLEVLKMVLKPNSAPENPPGR